MVPYRIANRIHLPQVSKSTRVGGMNERRARISHSRIGVTTFPHKTYVFRGLGERYIRYLPMLPTTCKVVSYVTGNLSRGVPYSALCTLSSWRINTAALGSCKSLPSSYNFNWVEGAEAKELNRNQVGLNPSCTILTPPKQYTYYPTSGAIYSPSLLIILLAQTYLVPGLNNSVKGWSYILQAFLSNFEFRSSWFISSAFTSVLRKIE